jgi:hypothetical protein
MAEYEAAVAAGNLPREHAMQQFSADLEAFNSNLERAQAINADNRERQIAEANRSLGLAGEATSRANSIATNILPNMTAGNAPSVRVPFLGDVMANQVNVPQLYSQGLPALADLPAIPSQGPEQWAGPLAAPVLPQYNAPALPDIGSLIAQLQSGSKPMGFA